MIPPIVNPNTPVLFLDIDEVLNCGQYRDYGNILRERLDLSKEELDNSKEWKEYLENKIQRREGIPGDWIQRDLLNHLHHIRDNVPGMRVVIISAWAMSNQEAKKVCDFLGVKKFVPKFCYRGSRGPNVEECIKKYRLTNYVVLDDSDGFYSAEQLEDLRYVIVNSRYGLTRDIADGVIKLFKENM